MSSYKYLKTPNKKQAVKIQAVIDEVLNLSWNEDYEPKSILTSYETNLETGTNKTDGLVVVVSFGYRGRQCLHFGYCFHVSKNGALAAGPLYRSGRRKYNGKKAIALNCVNYY